MLTYISALLIMSAGVVVKAQDPGQCYYPGGAWANDSRPCDPYAITTLCCPVGWTCFSNYACVVTDLSVVESTYPLGTTIRGSCTNPLWNDGFCGDFCLDDPAFSSPNNGSLVDCENGSWCCAADTTCDCSSGNGTFTIPQGVAQTIISVSGLSSTDTAAATSTSSTVTTTSSVQTTLATTTSSSSQTTGASRTSTQSSPTSSPSESAGARKTPVTSTTGFKMGVGFGGAAVAAILGFLAFWFCCRNKFRRHSNLDFASRSSSAGPSYTAVAPAYDTGRSEYGPFNPASVYGSPIPPIPARSSQPYSARTPSPLLTPDFDERPVTPEEEEEYTRNRRFPSMATLPREGP